MKKFSLLLLSVLFLSCSSDNSEDVSVEEGSFLDVYNGVIWSIDPPDRTFEETEWRIFTPNGVTEYYYYPNCETSTFKWGDKNSDGIPIKLLENSKNFLKIEIIRNDGSIIEKMTPTNDGNFLNIVSKEDGLPESTDKYYRVSEPCK